MKLFKNFNEYKINQNKSDTKTIIREKDINDISIKKDSFKNKYDKKYGCFHLINYFIIIILLCHFQITNSIINLKIDNIFNKIKLYSYIITLKVKSTGVNNILSSTIINENNHIYPCPSNIYLNNKLIQIIQIVILLI